MPDGALHRQRVGLSAEQLEELADGPGVAGEGLGEEVVDHARSGVEQSLPSEAGESGGRLLGGAPAVEGAEGNVEMGGDLLGGPAFAQELEGSVAAGFLEEGHGCLQYVYSSIVYVIIAEKAEIVKGVWGPGFRV